MDRLLNGLYDRTARQPGFQSPLDAMRAWSPAIDVIEKNHRLVVRVDLPGFRKGDVNVDVMEGRLAIWGGLKRENRDTESDTGRREREYGRFYQAVPLPEGVAFDGVKATFVDGVLEVDVPLPAGAPVKVRRIEVEDARACSRIAA